MTEKPIIITGLPSVGKTTLGNIISKKYKLRFIDLDIKFEEIYNYTPYKYILKYGFDCYRKKEYKILKETLNKNYELISTGGGIVEFEESRKLLKKIKNQVIYLIKNKNKLEIDMIKRFPDIYKEDFNKLYLRRDKHFNYCSKYRLNVNKDINESLIYFEKLFFKIR